MAGGDKSSHSSDIRRAKKLAKDFSEKCERSGSDCRFFRCIENILLFSERQNAITRDDIAWIQNS